MNASAFVVGPRDGAGAALAELARGLRFAVVERYQGLSRAEQQAETTPLLFFLCAAVEDVRELKPMADAIRFSPSLQLRFSPLIYLAPNLSADTIKLCIGMGFDDVIALPYGGGELGERIFRQVDRPHTYYETSTYFGPDRRHRLGAPRAPETSRGGGPVRRIEIIRKPDSGVSVLHDDFQVVV